MECQNSQENKTDFYLDENLRKMIELCYKRKQKNWDNLLIIDGDERAGKSTLARTICSYYSSLNKKPFSMKNIFFDPEEMIEFATTHKEEIILWDEGALGGQGIHWQNKIQQKLNTLLMIAGKYNHFYVFLIPSFFRLNRYLSIERSIGLLHVYSPDLISRGLFTCFNKAQKTWIYNNHKKSEMYGKGMSFRGRFTLKNTEKIVDDNEYELKKDNSIKKYIRGGGDKTQVKLEELQYRVVSNLKPKEAIALANISQKTYYNWKEKGEVLGYKL